jgi:hypothetical protein
MNPRRRAMLYSGLVLPGAGQFILHRPLRGLIFIMGAIVPLIAMFIRIWDLVSDRLLVPGAELPLIPDEQLLQSIHSQAWAQNWWLLAIIAAFWIASIVDAARSG